MTARPVLDAGSPLISYAPWLQVEPESAANTLMLLMRPAAPGR